MINVLAESATAMQIGIGVLVMVFLIQGSLGAVKLWKELKPKSAIEIEQPLITEMKKDFVERRDFDDLKADIHRHREELKSDMSEIKLLIRESVEKVENYAEKSYQSRAKIHEKVNGIDREVGSIKTRQDEQEKRANGISTLVRELGKEKGKS